MRAVVYKGEREVAVEEVADPSDAYEKFDNREPGYTKVVLDPAA